MCISQETFEQDISINCHQIFHMLELITKKCWAVKRTFDQIFSNICSNHHKSYMQMSTCWISNIFSSRLGPHHMLCNPPMFHNLVGNFLGFVAPCAGLSKSLHDRHEIFKNLPTVLFNRCCFLTFIHPKKFWPQF